MQTIGWNSETSVPQTSRLMIGNSPSGQSEGNVVVPFPADTVIPTGAVLLLTNTERPTVDASALSVVAETFALPTNRFCVDSA